MTLRYLLFKTAHTVNVWILKDGCTDPSTFKRLTGFEAQKEYASSNVEVKDFCIDNNTLIITI
jgi:hypothetical protein